ncbi:uncharacterized protein PG986_015013 [Apiospora aurea]|uniref:C2H2-type domain-containing protein n=1 Tax=Apiospora aurea TaxID=335848 RepID=A0ABR1PRB1_9PEZI
MAPKRKLESSACARQPEPGGNSSQQFQRQQQSQHDQRYESREANSSSSSGRIRTEENASRAMGYVNPWPPHYPYLEGQPLPPPTGPPGAAYMNYQGYDDPARVALRYARPPPSDHPYGGRHEPIRQHMAQHMAPQSSGFLGSNADPGNLGLPVRPYPPYNHLSPPYEPSFAQVHEPKRHRRRPEEIERIYKCGWEACTKGYGTLNHLNAHVTMQGHGEKRKPEEFKEIRRQWKARKKEQEQQERQRITDAEKIRYTL